MTRVVSYSLWGKNPLYTEGALRNAEECVFTYPGWECWMYCDDNVPHRVIEELSGHSHVTVINIHGVDNRGRFWRFYPCSDCNVELFISRDVDSRLSEKEAKAVDDWVRSGKLAHSMHDSRFHRSVFMAGMCGFRHEVMPDIVELVVKFAQSHKITYHSDQEFLRDIIFPRVKSSTLFHSAPGLIKRWPGSVQFPESTPVQGGFIGARVKP